MSWPALGAVAGRSALESPSRPVRALVVVEALPNPAHGGVDLRNLGNVNALALLGPVAVFGVRPVDGRPPPHAGIEMWERSHDPAAKRLMARGWSRPESDWREDPLGHPLSFPISDTVLTELAAVAERFEPDLVVVEQLWLQGCIDPCKQLGLPVVLDAHNVEGQLISDLVLSGGCPVETAARGLIAQRSSALEAAAVRAADEVWACSAGDAASLSRLYHLPAPVRVVPHALDLDSYPTADRTGGRDSNAQPAVVFPGVFSYPPNAEAARWLVEEIFPMLLDRFPAARLALVGRDPTPAMIAAGAADPRVTVTGAVTDARPYLTTASVMAVALRQGGGARLKVLEAFASGVPVVGTDKAMEGLEVVAGEHYLRAEQGSEYCEAVARLTYGGKLRRDLIARAGSYVRDRHTFEAVAEAVRAGLPPADRLRVERLGQRHVGPPSGGLSNGPRRNGGPLDIRANALTPSGIQRSAPRQPSGRPTHGTNGRRALSRPTVSLCVTTRGPAERVRALLGMLRPHVDEIVLAVDRTGDPRTAPSCAGLADRTLGYELNGASPAKLIGWAMHQCEADWILRLDDDEAPSSSLLEALPTLMADRRVTQVAFTRRWLFPNGGRYVVSFPWGHDSQTRLVRNLPSLWSFPGWNHAEGRFRGERRWVDLALYHCDLVVNELGARRRKSTWYERIEPGQHWDGFPLNHMYVPEDCGALKTDAVPIEDQAKIDSLLVPGPLGPTPSAPMPCAVPWDEIDRHNETSLDPSAGRAQIAFVRPRERVPLACVRGFQVVVRNLGSRPWVCAPQSPVRLGYRWVNRATGRVLPDEGTRTEFTETVWPGQSTRLHLQTRTPHVPGEFVLSAQVVYESRAWIDEPGHTPVIVESERPAEPAPFVPSELRVMSSQLWQQLDEADKMRAELARELALADRRGRELERLRKTRRYRFAASVARPLDALRARARAWS